MSHLHRSSNSRQNLFAIFQRLWNLIFNSIRPAFWYLAQIIVFWTNVLYSTNMFQRPNYTTSQAKLILIDLLSSFLSEVVNLSDCVDCGTIATVGQFYGVFIAGNECGIRRLCGMTERTPCFQCIFPWRSPSVKTDTYSLFKSFLEVFGHKCVNNRVHAAISVRHDIKCFSDWFVMTKVKVRDHFQSNEQIVD